MSLLLSTLIVLFGLVWILDQKKFYFWEILTILTISIVITLITVIPKFIYFSVPITTFINIELLLAVLFNIFLFYGFNVFKPLINSRSRDFVFFIMIGMLIFGLELINGLLLAYPELNVRNLSELLVINSVFLINYLLWALFIYFHEDRRVIKNI